MRFQDFSAMQNLTSSSAREGAVLAEEGVKIVSQGRLVSERALRSSTTVTMHVNIESKGRPSKWIILIVLRVLKRQA